MNPQTWWYMSRASGMVAWMVLGATCLWGGLLTTRMLKPADRPAWLLDLHRWLGALAVVTTGLHLGALVADNYTHFGWRELFVPQASAWKRGAVTWGVIGLYLMAVVQLTSLVMKRLPRRLWHAVHMLSYVLFAMVTVHGVLAGTDATNVIFVAVAGGGTAIVAFVFIARVLQGRAKRIVRAQANAAR